MTTMKVNMDKNTDSKWPFKLAFVTLWSIFVMGFINGMSINSVYMGVPVTPQTGNIIWAGLFAAFGNWGAFGLTMTLWGAFMLGAIISLYTGGLFKNPKAQFFYAWSTFAVPVLLHTLVFQYPMGNTAISFVLLGFASGAALGFFRKIYHMDQVNTAMATGNARFVGLHLARIFSTKDAEGKKKERATFIIFFLAIFAFAFGAFVYGMTFRMDAYSANTAVLNDYARFVTDHGRGLTNFGQYTLYNYYLAHGVDFGGIHFTHSDGGFNFRNIALIVFCVIPYLFFPKGKAADA